jgi:hypothetical protein
VLLVANQRTAGALPHGYRGRLRQRIAAFKTTSPGRLKIDRIRELYQSAIESANIRA